MGRYARIAAAYWHQEAVYQGRKCPPRRQKILRGQGPDSYCQPPNRLVSGRCFLHMIPP